MACESIIHEVAPKPKKTNKRRRRVARVQTVQPRLARLERAHEREELAHEAGESGQADGPEQDDEEQGRVERHPRLEAAELREVGGATPVDEEGDQADHAARDDRVVHHLDARAHQPGVGEGGEADEDEAHVGDRRIGEQPPRVGLDHREDARVQEPDHAQEHEPQRGRSDRVRPRNRGLVLARASGRIHPEKRRVGGRELRGTCLRMRSAEALSEFGYG